MLVRLPAALIRSVIRFALKPFLGPPFRVGFQRAWARLTSNLNLRAREAKTNEFRIDDMSVLLASAPGKETHRTVLYLHGGGYCIGSWGTHQGLITHLAMATNAAVYAPNYRLAPEHPHPAALEDSFRVYEWLLDQGVPSKCIAVVGDSAGGGLALATVAAIRERGLPSPASITLISPWTDLRCDSASMRDNARVDPMLRPAWSRECAASYLNGRDAGDPACSPLYARHEGLPPLLIQVGSDEILLDDSTRLADRCRVAGVDVTLQIFDGLWHEFQIHAGIMKEAADAVLDIADFLKDHFADPVK